MTMVDKINKVIEMNPEIQTMFDEMIKCSILISAGIMGEIFEYGDVTESEEAEYAMAWNEIVVKRAEELVDVVFDEQ